MDKLEARKVVEQLIIGLADDLRPEVERIEKSVPITKGHYDQYLAILTHRAETPGSTWEHSALIAAALLKAGANQAGVAAAFQLTKEGQHPRRTTSSR